MAKQTYEIELYPRQYEFLKRMADKYDLVDESKSVRVLVDFAVEKVEQQEDIFDEIRCFNCT